MKKNYLKLLAIVLAVVVSGCKTSDNTVEKEVQGQTLPYASIFLDKNENDGFNESGIQRIGEADSIGDVVVYLSEQQKKDYKKRVTVAKKGYEPARFKVKNGVVNDWRNLSPSKFSAGELYQQSLATLSMKKRMGLLRQTIYQDPNNEEGYGNIAQTVMTSITDRLNAVVIGRLEYKFEMAYLSGMGDVEGAHVIYPSVGFGYRQKHSYFGMFAGAAFSSEEGSDALLPVGMEYNLYIGKRKVKPMVGARVGSAFNTATGPGVTNYAMFEFLPGVQFPLGKVVDLNVNGGFTGFIPYKGGSDPFFYWGVKLGLGFHRKSRY